MSLAVFGPVLERLRHDERIEFWFMTSDDAWDGERIFRPAGVNDRIVTPDAARWMKFDAYVNTDFWNTTWLPRRPRRVHMFHGVAGKYGLDAPIQLAPTIASFDRLLFPNRDRLRRYAEAGLIDADGPQAALVGYPKVDCLVDGSLDRRAIERSLGIDPSIPTVLYAPTWSPYSSLHSVGVDVIRGLSRLGINVLVKLHDRSYDPGERASGGVDWRATLERLSRLGNVHVAGGSDASPYLFVSDALVTDHSSVGFEFMLLDRPVIVIDCPRLIEKARVNPDKVNELRGAAAVARTADEVAALVRRELDDPTRLSSRRRKTAEQLFYGAGRATGRAVQCIYDLLALPAPMTGLELRNRSADEDRILLAGEPGTADPAPLLSDVVSGNQPLEDVAVRGPEARRVWLGESHSVRACARIGDGFQGRNSPPLRRFRPRRRVQDEVRPDVERHDARGGQHQRQPAVLQELGRRMRQRIYGQLRRLSDALPQSGADDHRHETPGARQLHRFARNGLGTGAEV